MTRLLTGTERDRIDINLRYTDVHALFLHHHHDSFLWWLEKVILLSDSTKITNTPTIPDSGILEVFSEIEHRSGTGIRYEGGGEFTNGNGGLVKEPSVVIPKSAESEFTIHLSWTSAKFLIIDISTETTGGILSGPEHIREILRYMLTTGVQVQVNIPSRLLPILYSNMGYGKFTDWFLEPYKSGHLVYFSRYMVV